MTFHESDLIFNFSTKNWEIIQYDTHRYYKILSGAGLKGVDFLGIFQKKELVFFEVKHFHSNLPSKNRSYLIFEDNSKFIDQITKKLTDTLKAISVIIQFLERKKWYRLFLQLNKWIPNFLLKKKEWYFWHRLHQLVHQKELLTFVLWLEVEDTTKLTEEFHSNLTTEIEENLLPLVGKVKIVNRKCPIFEESLLVS